MIQGSRTDEMSEARYLVVGIYPGTYMPIRSFRRRIGYVPGDALSSLKFNLNGGQNPEGVS